MPSSRTWQKSSITPIPKKATVCLDPHSHQSVSFPLRIAYAGRASQHKGIYDWIEALFELVSDNFQIRATWFVDGRPELAAARRLVSRKSLLDRIRFVGAVDHAHFIDALRSFDAFMFCHKTQESPRCLVEALICGRPIVGYDSPYPRNLILTNGGGLLVSPDPKALACAIKKLGTQKKALTIRARMDGVLFDADTVFRHPSDLMKSIFPN